MRVITCGLLVAAVAAAFASTASPAPAGSPTRVGISGRWTIDVTRHHRVVGTYRFENALVANGMLPRLLAGVSRAGRWSIGGSEKRAAGGRVALVAPATFAPVASEQDAVDLGEVSASEAVTTPGTITSVDTELGICAAATSQSDCAAGTGASVQPFTAKSGLSIAVKQGDRVTFAVQLSVTGSGLVTYPEAFRNLLSGTAAGGSWTILWATEEGGLHQDDAVTASPSWSAALPSELVLRMTITPQDSDSLHAIYGEVGGTPAFEEDIDPELPLTATQPVSIDWVITFS